MRILVNDIAASSGGAKSILLDFYQYLVESGDANEWYFLLGEALIPETENIHVILLPDVKNSWGRRLLFDCIDGRRMVARIAPDVILSLQNTAIWGTSVSQYIYVHQSLPFQEMKRFSFFKPSERIYAIYQYLIGFVIKRSVKTAKGVFVQTQWMKDALASFIDRERILLLPPSVHIEERLLQEDVQIQTNRFFYPASDAIYKNHQAITQAVSALLEERVRDFRVDLTLPSTGTETLSPAQINRVGILPRETVMMYYRQSILLFPSYIETFGLPLAEARLIGGMIFAADTPFAREILDGYENARFFDPFDPSELKMLMKDAICGEISYRPVAEPCRKQESSWEILINALKGAL